MSERYRWIQQNRSRKLNAIMPQLWRKLKGFENYFGIEDNRRSLDRLHSSVLHSLYKWLNRRSQRNSFNWRGFKDMLLYFDSKPLRFGKRYLLI